MVQFNLKMLAILVSFGLFFQSATQAQVVNMLSGTTPTNSIYLFMNVGSPSTKWDNATDDNTTTSYQASRFQPSASVSFTYEIDWKVLCSIQNISMLFSNDITDLTIEIYNEDYLGWFSYSYTPNSKKITLTESDWTSETVWSKIRISGKSVATTKLLLYDLKVMGTQTYLNEGTFRDFRDGNYYKYIRLNNQVWMQQNLDYYVSGSTYYNDNETANKQYGRLYLISWSKIANVCPDGWRLPTYDELHAIGYTNMLPTGSFKTLYAGIFWSLKFQGLGTEANFASSTTALYNNGETNVISCGIRSSGLNSAWSDDPSDRFSVRCVKSTNTKSLSSQLITNPKPKGVYDDDGNLLESESTIASIFEVKAYPNPSTGKFTIDLGIEPTQATSIQIFSTTGKEIYRIDNVLTRTLPIELQEKGMLLIKITYGDIVKTRKIILN